MVRSEWLSFGRDFTVRSIAVETVGLCIFFFSFQWISNTEESQKVKKTKYIKILPKSKM